LPLTLKVHQKTQYPKIPLGWFKKTGFLNPGNYFLPDPQLPFPPPSITTLWSVPNYTTWWPRNICTCPQRV